MQLRSTADLDAALRASAELGAEGVLFGAVHLLESYPHGGGKIDLQVCLARIEGRELLFDRRYSKEVLAELESFFRRGKPTSREVTLLLGALAALGRALDVDRSRRRS